jgi:hopanoid biosynthesis associated RND transporter like protein HpnN
MKRLIVATVDWCWIHSKLVAAAFLALTLGLGGYAALHVRIDTDQAHLISPDIPYRVAERGLDAAFPQSTDSLVAVIDAPTSGEAEQAVNELRDKLAQQTDLFRLVRRPPEETYFRNHGLLFLSADDLTALSDRLAAAQPMIGTLHQDPSLRGFLTVIGLALQGIQHGQGDAASLTPLLDQLDKPAAAIAQGHTASPVNWSSMLGAVGEHDQAERVLITQPRLHFEDLVAGANATDAIRLAASELGITPEHGMRLRITGAVALADANFATVTQGAALNGALMLVAVLLLIWWAVKSARIVLSIMLALISGLMLTMFFGVVVVGTFNPISIAFAVMFVGIAVDFGIQFIVRYRHEQRECADPRDAMRSAAEKAAAPLSLAAIATAAGFLSFVPTDYTGVSQLGLIAGAGMVIALIVDFTLLPALLALMPPAVLAKSIDLPWGAADRWLIKRDKPVVIAFAALTLIGILLLPSLPLDFNPLHLQSKKEEAVSTLLDLAANPDSGVFAVDLLADPAKVKAIEARCDRPEILRCISLADFVPAQQPEKLEILQDAGTLLASSLAPTQTLPPPSVDQLRGALTSTAALLGDRPISQHLRDVAAQDDQAVLKLQDAVTGGLVPLLNQLGGMLQSGPITANDLPSDLVANWRAADGRERLQIYPRGDINDPIVRLAFDQAVTAISDGAPVSGPPISIQQSGQIVVQAFIRAGSVAVVVIFALLWLLLRKVRDSLLVLLPLLVGALLTVIGCVISGLAINYANIIALPLLLGVGVAFNIYFVINWRYGVTTPLQSPTTRAVLFSALTTASAFGSLAVSPHLGTASMGLLLFLSLGLSVITTFLLLPALFSVMEKRKNG